MKIGILSRNRALYSTRRLLQSARLAGHQVRVIDTLEVAVEIGARRRRGLPDVEAIIPRIGASITTYGVAVVRQFEAQNIVTTASAQAIAQSRDKLHSLQLMAQAGLPTPKTKVVADKADLWPAIEAVGGLPVVIKLLKGTQGRGVFLALEMATVETILKTVQRFQEQILVQEYISEASGTDIRVIVVGNQCVAAMQRTAVDGEFRANLHLGGQAKAIVPDDQTRRLALQAAQAHDLGVAGVDLLRAKRGRLLLEVNSSPGLEGIETATGVDIGAKIVHYLEQLASRQKKRHPRGGRRRR